MGHWAPGKKVIIARRTKNKERERQRDENVRLKRTRKMCIETGNWP